VEANPNWGIPAICGILKTERTMRLSKCANRRIKMSECANDGMEGSFDEMQGSLDGT